MRNNNQTKRWLPAAVFGVLVAVLLFPSHKVQGAQAGIDAVVSAAAQILYHNEGSYDSVNANDNGAVSVGIFKLIPPGAALYFFRRRPSISTPSPNSKLL